MLDYVTASVVQYKSCLSKAKIVILDQCSSLPWQYDLVGIIARKATTNPNLHSHPAMTLFTLHHVHEKYSSEKNIFLGSLFYIFTALQTNMCIKYFEESKSLPKLNATYM